MATPAEKLAQSLEVLHELQGKGVMAIRSTDLSRVHRERLLKQGFLREVMKGWHIPARPDEIAGESTAWYASFWEFCATYLEERFSDEWCLSPEQSVSIHSGSHTVPRQLAVRSPKGGNKPTALLHGTSIIDIRAALPDAADRVLVDGLRLYNLPAALVACSPGYFQVNAIDARAALSTVRDASEVLRVLLEGGHSVVAGRLAGAFRNIGRGRIAEEIVKTMRAADYTVRESDPFDAAGFALPPRALSPYVNRVSIMWDAMRAQIGEAFPAAPGKPNDVAAYLAAVEENYVTDAYHSLSIEGYRVSPELIERVRSGAWNPDVDEADKEHRDALAARGYWQAYQAVRESVERVLGNANPGVVADEDHRTWYLELFAPSVASGIVKPADLAGYRSGQVFIRCSMHVPPQSVAVRDLMPALFELLAGEEDPAVRVVLGHFVFVYVHPYMDGNGRMGRFLMNLMLAAGGYPWTVVPVQRRSDYMAALEQASVGRDIVPFARLLGGLVKSTMRGADEAKIPVE